ncbi:MAG: primase [Fusobacteriales bacterium]|jgi:DNA primase|nr:primase [Fusobacteriales bacterium]
MRLKFREEDIQKLLDNVNIVDVVSEYVPLQKTGANYKGLCPFHQDRNPSFMISPSKNISKCFVCGKGGNPITFYKEYHKISYEEAVLELAKKYNINIKVIGKYNKINEKNSIYYEILNEALEFYKENIFKNDGRSALDYLYKRGFSVDFIKKYNIGYSLNNWNSLYEYLLNKSYNIEDIKAVGLIKQGENGYYDTFRDRIMFPIYSVSGNIIGFGGRILEDRKDIAKYLNSPETVVFNKGRNLYGIEEKGFEIKKKNYAILMEGYMDVLRAKSFGFNTAIASLGTSLTESQAKLLKKFTSNVIIAYDMDNAGQEATERAIMILKSNGFNIKIVTYKDAKDPDELLTKFGKAKFLEAIKESKEDFQFLYEKYVNLYNINDIVGKKKFIEHFKEFFQNINSELEKNLYIEKFSKQIDIEIDVLKDILIDKNKKTRVYNTEIINNFVEKQKIKKRDKIEEDIIRIFFLNKDYIEYFKSYEFKDEYFNLIKNYMLKKDKGLKEILNSNEFSEENKKEILDIVNLNFKLSNNEEKEKFFLDTLIAFIRRDIKEKMKKYRETNDTMSYFKLKIEFEKLKNLQLKEEILKFYNQYILSNIEKE